MTGARRLFAWSEPQITTNEVYHPGVTIPIIPGPRRQGAGGAASGQSHPWVSGVPARGGAVAALDGRAGP
jgi:hypothetical protein